MEECIYYLQGLLVSIVGICAIVSLGFLFEYLYNHKWEFIVFHGIGIFFIGLSYLMAAGLIIWFIPLIIIGYPLYYVIISNLTEDKEEGKHLPTSFSDYADFIFMIVKNIKYKLVRWYERYIE